MEKIKIPGAILNVKIRPDGSYLISAILFGSLFQENGMWVSDCRPLDLATCGKTKKEALENTREAIEGWFHVCMKKGTLDAALKELGWISAKPKEKEILARAIRDGIVFRDFKVGAIREKENHWHSRVAWAA